MFFRHNNLHEERLNNIKNKIETNRAKVKVRTKENTNEKNKLDEVRLKICEQDMEIKKFEDENKELEEKVVKDAKRLSCNFQV